MKRLVLLTGLLVGYVAGARAGRERYDALARAARSFADRPEVQSAAGTVAGQVAGAVRATRPGGR